MLATLISTRCLAARIRRAYLRRRTWWTGVDPDASVWSAAATVLLDAHLADPRLPLDPELFVVAQGQSEAIADPWGDLVGPAAVRRYRKRIVRIIRRLRKELRSELRLIRARILRGQTVEWQVIHGGKGLSPLGRYVAAVRFGRDDLAEVLRDDALRQHAGCPLYRQSCRGLVPESRYPAAAPRRPAVDVMPTGPVVGWN